MICKRAGCSERVEAKGVGRPPEFCSPRCRERDARDRELTRLAVDVAERLQASSETGAVRALAGLPRSSLLLLLGKLTERSRAS